MKELTPQEYSDLLNDDGELLPNSANENQKAAIFLAKTIKPLDGAALQGQRCFFCGGTGFQKYNPQFTCPHCNGRGWR